MLPFTGFKGNMKITTHVATNENGMVIQTHH
jgi:hypothetical protein